MRNIFHVFLRIIAFLQTPRPDPEGSMTGVMKAWTLEQRVSVRYEHRLHTCWLFPRPSHEGTAWGETRRSGLCQCSVLGKIDQGKFCSLQSGVTAGLRVDSAPQSNRGCRPPDPLHQISCSALILVARSWTLRATLLLLSRFSRVRLCATPEMAAHQAPPSLGFSR